VSELDIQPSRDEADSALASKRRMGLIAGGVVVVVGLGAAVVSSRRAADPDASGDAKRGAAVESSPDEATSPGTAFLPVGGKLPSGSSRAGFVPASVDGRHVAQMTSPGKLAFRLAPDATRYGVSSIARLSGAPSASLTPNLDGQALPAWALREGWSFYASLVDSSALGGGSRANANAHELLFTAGTLPAGAAIEVESVLVAPILDRVSFDTGPESEGHWVDGFHRRERGAIWSRGLKSAIGVVLEPLAVPYQLKVQGRTLAGLGPLLVKARVNERDIGSAEVTTKVEDVAWSVPAGLLERGANRIELEYPKTGQPAAFNPSSRDTRELAFRISAVELAPAE
jgi:hypothetical protein